MLEFEWDEAKAWANRRAHGVAFHEAVKAFRDPFAIEHPTYARNMAKNV
jgi:uncharacterized DUF497 family protein